MKAFLEYIVSNYTWFLSGTIIILLAIIGSYAEKTNFGQGRPKEPKNENTNDFELPQDKTISEYVNDNINGNDFSDLAIPTEMDDNNSKKENYEDFEKSFQNFDEEFNEVLPEKDIIDDDLLDDIDDLSFDKTQKINLGDIPDLDDVELPEIKKIKSDDENIWGKKK